MFFFFFLIYFKFGFLDFFFFFPPNFVEGILPLIFYILSTISEEEHVNHHPFIHAHTPPINSTGRTDEQLRMNEYTIEEVFSLTSFVYLQGYGLVVTRGKQKLAIFSGKGWRPRGSMLIR